MNTERQEKVKQLYEEIWNLENEDVIENRKNILPFLKSNCRINYSHGMGMTVSYVTVRDESDKEKLINFIKSKQDNGYNHYGCPISDNVDIRYDDGDITINFKFGGPIKEIRNSVINECKLLKLKLNFKDVKYDYNAKIHDTIKSLNEIIELEKQFQ